MSIQGLGGVYGPPGVIPRTPGEGGLNETARQQEPAAPLTHKAASGQILEADLARSGELPVEAPPGTDPQLWSVLTAEERQYFAQAKAMGPVTYAPGRLGLADMALHRGGRLDVRA